MNARMALCIGCALVLGTGAAAAADGEPPARIVSVDGALTEIVYALGAADRLVGVDTTSLYPPQTEALAKVGYKRALSAEGLLGLAPDLLLATDDAGPPEVLEQIERAGLAVQLIPDTPTVAGLHEKIDAVATVLGEEAAAAELRAGIDQALAAVQADLAEAERPRVLFLLHTGSGNELAGGRDTAVDTVIRLAGGTNVLHDAFAGYKPLSAEAAVAAAPAVILVSERNLTGLGGKDALLARPSLVGTPAARAGRVVAMDGPLLLAFGPRLGDAVAELAQALGTLRDASVAADGNAARTAGASAAATPR
jgi:iron complex transport system substrate-binding protein